MVWDAFSLNWTTDIRLLKFQQWSEDNWNVLKSNVLTIGNILAVEKFNSKMSQLEPTAEK